MSNFLPYARQSIDEDDIAAVIAVLRGDWLTTGPIVARFEEHISKQIGTRHVVSCANGPAALHLAMLAMRLGKGDIAVVPTVTFSATANAVRYVGGEVVFADVDPETGLMTADTLSDALEHDDNRAKVVLPVHLAGQVADPAGIACVARHRGIRLVIDASHAFGTSYAAGDIWVGSGQHADMTVFSFHAVKNITSGEGGAVATVDDELARSLHLFRSHGIERTPARFEQHDMGFGSDGETNPWYYELQELGFNYRITDFQCALGLSQLAKLDRFRKARMALVALYDRLLAPLAPLVRPTNRVPECTPFWHLYVTLIDFDALGIERGRVMHILRERGIGTQVHYVPLHRQPYYRRRYGEITMPGADRYYERCLSLPLHNAMTTADVERVVATLTEVLGRD